MDSIPMNSKYAKTSDPRRLLLNLTDKIDLRRKDKYIALSNLIIYYTWKNIKKPYKNNEFKISAPTQNEQLELPDGLYSLSDIQECFEYILKKHGEKTVNLSIKIYINNTENRITFKIKTGYYLELLTLATMKLPGSTKTKITKYENSENVPNLEITEVVLVHYNFFNDYYQRNSRVLDTFVPNKPFGQLLDVSPKNLKTFDSELLYIEVWFTDQNSNPPEIGDKINITLVIS